MGLRRLLAVARSCERAGGLPASERQPMLEMISRVLAYGSACVLCRQTTWRPSINCPREQLSRVRNRLSR